MNKEELDEYRDYVLTRYDELLEKSEGRGASWGECAHVQNLNQKELDELCAEIDAELERIESQCVDKKQNV